MHRLSRQVLLLGINYPPEPTGISPYTGAMARGLARRGNQTRVLTAHPHYPDWKIWPGYGQWSKNEQSDGVAITRLLHYVPRRPVTVRRALSELSFGLRLMFTRWGRPDAVIAASPALISTALALVRARVSAPGVPFIVWVQDLYSLGLSETGQGGGAAARAMRAIEGWLLRRATRVIVIHDRFARRVHEDFGVPSHRIVTVRNWTHLSESPRVHLQQTRHELGWGDETVVLHAGNMGVKQGLDNVVKAARIAGERGERIRFVLLGAGGERDRLRETARGLGNLQFIDPLPDAKYAAALHAADILLVNELEGVSEMAVPSKLTSYFSTGRPVIAATDPQGITADEIVASGGGVVVAAGRPAALVDSIVDLRADRQRSDDLGAQGLEYRRTVLSETSAIDAFDTLLSGLTAAAERPPSSAPRPASPPPKENP